MTIVKPLLGDCSVLNSMKMLFEKSG